MENWGESNICQPNQSKKPTNGQLQIVSRTNHCDLIISVEKGDGPQNSFYDI